MSNQAVVAIGIRLMGIWILITNVPPLLQFFSQLIAQHGLIAIESPGIPWVHLFFSLVWLGFAAAAVWSPTDFARLLLPNRYHKETDTPWTVAELERIAFSALGLYLLVDTLASSFNWITVWSFIGQQRNVSYSFEPMTLLPVLVLAIKVGVGLWLLLGSGSLSRLLRRVRQTG